MQHNTTIVPSSSSLATPSQYLRCNLCPADRHMGVLESFGSMSFEELSAFGLSQDGPTTVSDSN